MPVATSSQPSGIDAKSIRSAADLPAAFGCPGNITPITIPPTTRAGTPTAQVFPSSIVCASRIADGEAVYLWYYATQEEKLAALTAALAQTKYVRAGANWVAGAMINPGMGTVGGDVFK